MALIINELLCYMLAKIDSVPTDALTRLVNENFSDSEVDAAKSLLCEHVDDAIKAGNKRGQHKKKHDLDDIVKMLEQCDRSSLPGFVALELSKLPPISIDCIDVSSLMRKQQLQEVEISNFKSMMQEILSVTAETSKRVEMGLLSSQASSSVAAACSLSGSGVLSPPSASSSGESAPDAAEPAQGCSSRPSYSDVLREAVASSEDGSWSVANRRKRVKAPTPRKTADPSPSTSASAASSAVSTTSPPTSAVSSSSSSASSTLSYATAGGHKRLTAKKVVIGSRTTGPIKAVAAVKRTSIFLSRLPPGTGEDAIMRYVKEQTGADDVTALKLQTRYDSYESYRLDITNPSCKNVLDPDLWAQGLVVRRFFVRRQPAEGQLTAAGEATARSGYQERD